MKQNDPIENLRNCVGTIYRKDGSNSLTESKLAREYYLDIYVNDGFFAQLLCTPEYLTELTIGHLATTGVITGNDCIQEIKVDPVAKRSEVILKKKVPILNPVEWMIVPTEWKPEWIFAMANDVTREASLYKITKGTHGCAIGVNGKTLFRCDDLGRHNAIDKAIGYALMQQIPLESCILLSTGRITTDMVKKVLYSKIPVFATLKTPTSEAIAMAKQHHLTMICKVDTDQFVIYDSDN